MQRRIQLAESRIQKLEEQIAIADKELSRMTVLLGILQKLAFGGVGLVLTSIIVALLALVVRGLST